MVVITMTPRFPGLHTLHRTRGSTMVSPTSTNSLSKSRTVPPGTTRNTTGNTVDWMDGRQVKQVRRALEQRSSYLDGGGSIEMVQTHISTVFLTPRFVFKFKRPLDLGFADFRTLSSRRRYCRAELRLNRRLAPDVYLDVLALYHAGGQHAGGPEGRFHLAAPPAAGTAGAAGTSGAKRAGRIVDYCVVMKRLPADEMLDQRIAQGAVSPAELGTLAEVLVRFHGMPQHVRGASRYGSLAVIRENWEENFRQTLPHVGEVLPEADFMSIQATVRDFLSRNGALFHERISGGFIRDGHGDLRCEHVHLGAGPIRIIDCIEFNDRFRFGDVANDLAFLLMDLKALGHPEMARVLLARYLELSGDGDLERLLPFYACYRAWVRGKVTAFKLGDTHPNSSALSPSTREEIRRKAAAFFDLAGEFARQMAPPVLAVLSGLMGTGKSALAAALSERTGIRAYASDVLRKEMAAADSQKHGFPKHRSQKHGFPKHRSQKHGSPKHGDSPSRAGTPFGEGIYTPDWSKRTYDALLAMAGAELRAGRSVILDASFSQAAQRRRALALASQCEARSVIVECRLDDARTLARLRGRTRRGGSVSDGRVDLFPAQQAAFEPIAGLPGEQHLVLDMAAPPGDLAARVMRSLGLPPPLFAGGPAEGGLPDGSNGPKGPNGPNGPNGTDGTDAPGGQDRPQRKSA